MKYDKKNINISPFYFSQTGQQVQSVKNIEQQYISVTLAADNNDQTTEYNMFNTGSYGGAIQQNVANGIVFSAASGNFEILYDGVYKLDFHLAVYHGDPPIYFIVRIKKNNVAVWSGYPFVQTENAMFYTMFVILKLVGGDLLECTLANTAEKTMKCMNGTIFNIVRIA